jgi:hypothetical protein
MNPITVRDVIAHQQYAPWGQLRQVEQDLLLCRSMVSIFSDKFLKSQVAPAARYSEDIDLVVIGNRRKGHISRALIRVLTPVLGKPTQSVWDWMKLAVRNAGRPSEILRLVYSLPVISDAGANLTIKMEANVDERQSHRPIVELPFSYSFQGATEQAVLNGYDLHEMLGTKLRALFQSLYWALSHNPSTSPAEAIASFHHYLRMEGATLVRSEFVGRLHDYLRDRGFCTDMTALLRTGINYDPQEAGRYVEDKLLSLLPA